MLPLRSQSQSTLHLLSLSLSLSLLLNEVISRRGTAINESLPGHLARMSSS